MTLTLVLILSLLAGTFASESVPKPSDAGTASFSIVNFKGFMPKHPFQTIKGYEPAELLILAENLGPRPVTITSAYGFLVHAENMTIPLRNLTRASYSTGLLPGETATIPYKFTIRSESMNAGLLVAVDFVTDQGFSMNQVAYKEAIRITSSLESFTDIKSLFLYALGLFVVLFSSYVGLKPVVNPPTTVKKTYASVVKSSEKKESNRSDEDWLPEHVKKQAFGKNATAARAAKK